MKFFAEGLPRLGIVNLQILLDDYPVSDITLSVTAGVSRAVLCNDKQTFVLDLPLRSSLTETFTYQPGQTDITARISTERSVLNEELAPVLSAEQFSSKWSQGAKLTCRECHQNILTNPQMRWKDLPSESWAEYSDYWLCHPGGSHSHNHSHTTQTSEEKINNHPIPNLTARLGVSLVGLTSILLDAKDLQNMFIKVLLLVPFALDSKKVPLCVLQQRGADTRVPKKIPHFIPFSCGFMAILKFITPTTKTVVAKTSRDDIPIFEKPINSRQMMWYVNVGND
jgi:hypothetical protein